MTLIYRKKNEELKTIKKVTWLEVSNNLLQVIWVDRTELGQNRKMLNYYENIAIPMECLVGFSVI